MAARDELAQLRRMQELETRISVPKTVEKPQGLGGAFNARMNLNARKLYNLSHTIDDLLLGQRKRDPEGIASKETIARLEKEHAGDTDSGMGLAGSIAADVASTAPLGFIGKGMEGLSLARNVPRVLSRTLASRPIQAGVEGALAGGMLADPGERKEGATLGSIIGVGGERVGAGIGRAVGGLVKRSPDAKALEQIADLHGAEVKMPLSIAADDKGVISPLIKFIYDKVLPNLPGAEGALAKQGQRASAQFREIAMKEAAPGGMGSTQPGYAAGLPLTTGKQPGAGSNVRATMQDIQKAFENEYADTIKSYVFNKPNSADLATRLQQKFPNIDSASLQGVVREFDTLVNRYSNNGVLDGDNLLRVKNRLAHLGREAGEDRVGQSFYQAQELLDDVVRAELRQGNNPQNLIDLQRYEDLAEPYRKFLRVQKAAGRSKSPSGDFTPTELKGAARTMSGDAALARGNAPMQELAEIGQRTVGQPMHQPSFLERGLTMGALGGAGVFSGPMGVGALLAGGRAAASPAVQDVLMGTNKAQQALTKALRNNPKKVRMAGAAIRNTMAGEVADNE